jgi:putative ABC transport system permease protein
MPEEYYSAISYFYGIDPTNNIYTSFVNSYNETNNMSLSSVVENYKAILADMEEYKSLSSYIDLFSESVSQAPGNEDYILSQYDVLEGSVATKENEIMVVVSKNTELTDVVLAQLGYYHEDEFLNLAKKAANSDDSTTSSSEIKKQFSYEELLNKTFYYYPNNDVYNATGDGLTPFTYNYQVNDNFSSGMELKVTGILRAKDNISYGCLDSGFYYTPEFTKRFLKDSINSEIVNYLNDTEKEEFTCGSYNGMEMGIGYNLSYISEEQVKTKKVFVGQTSSMSSLISMVLGTNQTDVKTLSLRNLGGVTLANNIYIYPIDFNLKSQVTDYLDLWNDDSQTITLSNGKVLTPESRSDVKYNDTIGLIISMVNVMINAISIALIVFTALSLVVSTVMIGIITYVSVVERIKEIGVIRALGGRKRDVSNLFMAETIMIGLFSGIFGIGFTYLIQIIVNLSLKSLIGFNIAALPLYQALIMIGVSVILTTISGVFPARSAARKDPVVALRTE